jgi:hypothetical protein
MTNKKQISTADLDMADKHGLDPARLELAPEQEMKFQTEEKAFLPICPHCDADPFLPAICPVSLDDQHFVIYCCSTCRKVITMGRIAQPQKPALVAPPPDWNLTRRH